MNRLVLAAAAILCLCAVSIAFASEDALIRTSHIIWDSFLLVQRRTVLWRGRWMNVEELSLGFLCPFVSLFLLMRCSLPPINVSYHIP
jgi:hypothetical protein